ncbi:unnamed protein product [Dracunculus medinensis]|uniref:BHLH domain-containing protein n=1 Tax=Dracunculus medinensis TaxID=318479 RepID=A0A0N4UN92_DRAME|nr:unnamed protein product [Dracunculus medinensis]
MAQLIPSFFFVKIVYSRCRSDGSPLLSIPIHSPSFRQVVSSSAPTSSLDMDTIVRCNQDSSNEPEFCRDRRKKDIHNMIERRRRYNINDRIKELGLMLPKHSAEEMKLNKGTILKASCDYIRQLQNDRDLMLKQQQEVSELKEALQFYGKRVKELEDCLLKNGIPIPPPSSTLPISFLSATNSLECRTIKQEPFDDLPPSPSNAPQGFGSGIYLSHLSETTAAMRIASPINFQNSHLAKDRYDNNYFRLNSFILNVPLCGQMSPEIKWDQSGFSPDDQRNQSSGFNSYQSSSMDFS